MAHIRVVTEISVPRSQVFDLARSIDAHMASTGKTKECAIDGVTTGLIGLGETVTWEARHFGIRQRLQVQITAYEYPELFVDEMIFGAFKSMKHTHRFIEVAGGTEMVDEFEFISPMGVLGKFADWLFLKRYMERFLIKRNQVLKALAEGEK
jgi:ligand-binding SRPBCC domain-containing protein